MMRPRMERAPARPLRYFGLVVAAGLLVTACSGAVATAAPAVTPATPASATTPTSALSTPTPVPTKGPATAQLTISGDPAAAALTTNMSVQCDEPSFDGPEIVLYRQASAGGVGVRIVISQSQVSVRFASGSGKTYLDREFVGTGVVSFDAATGAQFDSSLATAPYAGATGDLGTLSAIKGSVDCGNELPGSSTLTISGSTGAGQLSAITLSSARVECDQSSAYGNSVQVIGLATVGTAPTLFIVQGTATGFTVAQEPKDATTAFFYINKTAGSAALTTTGMHISGDATEQNVAAGKTAHTVTVSGDATCGSTVVS
jgi:hypothetical protein